MTHAAQNTKQGREESRDYQFNKLIEQGYTRETYKKVDFFTKLDGKYFTLKVYRGTSAKAVKYINYRSEESRSEAIKNYKVNFDSLQDWKAEQKAKGQTSNHAGAAAMIKAELTAAFKGIKFSVTSDSYTGGDAVRISWTDGATVEQVEAISAKYQYGSFNGMEDIYEYTNTNKDIPQTKYVTENRHESTEVEALREVFIAMFDPTDKREYHNEPAQIFYRIFRKTSLPAIYSNLRIEKTDCKAGQWEDFYIIAFDTPEVKQEATIAPQYTEVEKVSGEVNIVDYSPKAFAVIGDTKPIKEQLKALGGSFNPRLTCGAGWIFSKKKLEEVTKALSGGAKQTEVEEVQEVTEEETKVWRRHPELEHGHPLNLCDPNGGQYKECLKEYEALKQVKAELKDEVKMLVQDFAKIDIEVSGKVSELTKEVATVQKVDLFTQEQPQHYTNLADINAATKSGKIISLCNLSELVNNRANV